MCLVFLFSILSFLTVCGKDKTHSKHVGNQIYRAKIEQLASQYAAATTKQGKMYITRGIVESMQCTHGSRFLRQVNTPTNTGSGNGVGWMELTDQQARDKTSHALRFYLKNIKHREGQPPSSVAQLEPRSSNPRRRCPVSSSIEQQHLLLDAASTTSSTQASSMASSTTIPATVTSSSSSSSSVETAVQIAIPIDDPIFARQQAILQQSMFVTASATTASPSPSIQVDPMVVVSSSASAANIPMAIAMDIDVSDRFDVMTRSEDFSIFNGNTLRSEDLNALFNSSLSSVEAMMVVASGAETAHHPNTTTKTATDTMRSEDLNYIFSLQDDEWDEVMKD